MKTFHVTFTITAPDDKADALIAEFPVVLKDMQDDAPAGVTLTTDGIIMGPPVKVTPFYVTDNKAEIKPYAEPVKDLGPFYTSQSGEEARTAGINPAFAAPYGQGAAQQIAAIKALINGQFDDPTLAAVGPLHPDLRTNVQVILGMPLDVPAVAEPATNAGPFFTIRCGAAGAPLHEGGTGPDEPVWYFDTIREFEGAKKHAAAAGRLIQCGMVDTLPEDELVSDMMEFVNYLNLE